MMGWCTAQRKLQLFYGRLHSLDWTDTFMLKLAFMLSKQTHLSV